MNLYKERPRLNIRANSFSNRVTNTWNQLRESVVMAPSLDAFKDKYSLLRRTHPQSLLVLCPSYVITYVRWDISFEER